MQLEQITTGCCAWPTARPGASRRHLRGRHGVRLGAHLRPGAVPGPARDQRAPGRDRPARGRAARAGRRADGRSRRSRRSCTPRRATWPPSCCTTTCARKTSSTPRWRRDSSATAGRRRSSGCSTRPSACACATTRASPTGSGGRSPRCRSSTRPTTSATCSGRRRRCAERLAEQGRQAWVDEEMEQRYGPQATLVQDPDQAWRRVSGRGRLRGEQLSALAAVAAWREREARRRDLPASWLIKDATLIEVARRRPSTAREAESIRGLQIRKGAQLDGLLAAVAARRADATGRRPTASCRARCAGACGSCFRLRAPSCRPAAARPGSPPSWSPPAPSSSR